MVTISGRELRTWVEMNSRQWREFFLRTPEALALPCDIRETKNVAELLQHIVAVEVRYAQRLCGLRESTYDEIRFDSAEVLYGTHDVAMNLLRSIEDSPEEFWDEWLEFSTRKGGTISRPRRIVYVHLLMHSVRHYAQLATLMRQHSFPAGWPMDYIAMAPNAVEKAT